VNIFVYRIPYTPLMRSGMARANKGSYSFTCRPHGYPRVNVLL